MKLIENTKQVNTEKIASAMTFALSKYSTANKQNWEKYYVHCLNVFRLLKKYGYGIDYQLAGLFHNLPKNANATYDEIMKHSNADVAEAVKIVSLEEIEFITEDYMNKVKKNGIALPVSLADRLEKLNSILSNNLDLIRKKRIIIEDTKIYFDALLKDSPFKEDYCKTMHIINKRR
jgi:(p)ppGpp synthase/HD superfamily hydrolase